MGKKLLFYALAAAASVVFVASTTQPVNTTVFTTHHTIFKKSPGRCQAKLVSKTDDQAWLPDPRCTPGTLNSAVTQDTIHETICLHGYTKTIRPPVSYTNDLKTKGIQDYGYADKNLKHYEEDHFISLQLGGHPSDPRNLWPEPHPSINEKDRVENYLRKQVCTGEMTLAEAQWQISQNWYSVWEGMQ